MVFIGRTFDQKLHLKSSQESFSDAQDLRQNQTSAEQILWSRLRNQKCGGLKFRRQHPILSFVADFYCHEKRLIVEVDGSVHLIDESKERDESRTYELERHGIKILRFTNDQIFYDIKEVLKQISEFNLTLPSTQGKGDNKVD